MMQACFATEASQCLEIFYLLEKLYFLGSQRHNKYTRYIGGTQRNLLNETILMSLCAQHMLV